MLRLVLLFLIGLAAPGWSDTIDRCDPEALAVLGQELSLTPKLFVELSEHPTYQKEASQTLQTYQFTEKIDSLPFFEELARRVKTHRDPLDEKGARRLVDRVVAEKYPDLSDLVRDQITNSLVKDTQRQKHGGKFLNGDELQLLVKEDATFDLGQVAANYVNAKLDKPEDGMPKPEDVAAEELVILGLQAIADNLPGIPHPDHAKEFKKYMEELKKKNRNIWKGAVPQIHAVLLAMTRGEDVTRYKAKAVRGGMVEITLGSSAHRILVTHGEGGQPPVILNWGDVKASHGQQTKFIEKGRDRKKTIP